MSLSFAQVWSLRCDVHILDHEGNATDCAVLAAITALHAFRRPDVTVVGDAGTARHRCCCCVSSQREMKEFQS